MAQGKQTPRQKMINLMYLVFIAMLAMQIDQEIIRSYKDTNQSLTDTRNMVEEKNDKIFEKTLQAKAAASPEVYGPLQEQYKGLEAKTDDLVSFIDGLKGKMSTAAEYDPNLPSEESFTALNNTEPATKLFFNDGDEKNPSKTAAELKTKMDDLRNYITTTFASNQQFADIAKRVQKTLVPDFVKGDKRAAGGKNWIQYKFYNQPLIAALSNLEVIQSEARNLQSDAISSMLQEKVDADIKFDAYEALVQGPKQVLQGSPQEVKVAIGTRASAIPGLQITGVSRIENGQGIATLNAGAVGPQALRGEIKFTDKNGKVHSLPYEHTYDVIAGVQELKAQKGALLSADKMNVLYRGLPNPVSGSILGASGNISLSASGASVGGGNGKWTVTPSSGNEVTLTISGKDPKGATISQPFKFRVKNVPPPVGQIRGRNVVAMPASSIANQSVTVAMPDFDFPVSFSVNSFMFKVPGKAAMRVNGSSLSAVEGLTKGLRSGDIAIVFDIQATATGLGGQVLQNIPGIAINVQ